MDGTDNPAFETSSGSDTNHDDKSLDTTENKEEIDQEKALDKGQNSDTAKDKHQPSSSQTEETEVLPNTQEVSEFVVVDIIDTPEENKPVTNRISDQTEEVHDPNKDYGTFPASPSSGDETDFFPASATNQFDILSSTNPEKTQRKAKNRSKTYDSDTFDEETSPNYVDDLTQWKDRTQAAATTSLSLVQVALLRDVINGGRDTYRHYVATITILALCIVLEIVSGFLIITLYMLKSRAQALTNLDSLQVEKQQGQDTTDGSAIEDDLENLESSGKLARKTFGLDLACCACYKPDIEDVLRNAIRRKYLQELRFTLRYPNYDDLEDVRHELDLLRRRRRIMQKFLTQVKMTTSYQIIIRLQSSITYIFYILSLFNIFVVIFGVSRDNRSNEL